MSKNEPVNPTPDRLLDKKIEEMLSNPEEIDFHQARHMVLLQLLIGLEVIETKYVRVLLSGTNGMGVDSITDRPDQIDRYSQKRARIVNIIKDWLREHYILVKGNNPFGRDQRFDEAIGKIPNFDILLEGIVGSLPLDENNKLPKLRATEEGKLILIVFDAIEGCYEVTMSEPGKKIFAEHQFNTLVGFIIKRFLYDFPIIGIDDPERLGKKIDNVIRQNKKKKLDS